MWVPWGAVSHPAGCLCGGAGVQRLALQDARCVCGVSFRAALQDSVERGGSSSGAGSGPAAPWGGFVGGEGVPLGAGSSPALQHPGWRVHGVQDVAGQHPEVVSPLSAGSCPEAP